MKLNYLKLLDKVGTDMGIVPVHLSRTNMVDSAVSTGSLVADLIIGGGWPAGRWVALFGLEASGKAQPLYSLIKVPGGWKTVGEVVVGDIVSTPDGKIAKVSGVFPQGIRPTYRITFEDGRTTDCDENHLWKVYCDSWTRKSRNNHTEHYKVEDPERVMSLKEIIEWKNSHKRNDLFIPLLKCVSNSSKDLPLDPYILGLLLGDGYLGRTTHFINVDEENLENLSKKLVEGYELKKVGNTKCDYILTHGKKNVPNQYTAVLKSLGLQGKKAWEKFIPEIYKEASIEQRLELLRGLMDTDGEASKPTSSNPRTKVMYEKAGGTPVFSTSSHQLALDIQYLVRSLGGLCRIRIKKSFYKTKEGTRKRCRTCFKCSIRHKNPEILIKLNRKRERVKRSLPITLRCKIKSIKFLGMQETQCIMIEHPDHLYITDGFVVTHNSSLLYHTLGDALRQEVNAEFFDFEGSTDVSYLKKILNMDVNKVFGLRKDSGTWEITPQCRYHQPDLGEPIFRYMHRILKILPDKIQNAGQWYYVYDKKPKKEDFDKKLYKNTGRFWIPAEDGSLQVIWFIDSLPAMLTERQDNKDETNEIGLQARMFSKNIPLIKSRLARKRCSVVAVNQIRMKPMAFGNPYYEPCGEAPRFYSDIRLQCNSCSNPFGKGQIEEEPCWDSMGVDRYRYVKICTRKNKCFSPFRESLMRIWMEEKGDIGRGLDPVFDTFQYLKETGQIIQEGRGTKKVYRLTIPGIWTQRIWKYKEFKELILNPNKAEVYSKYKLNAPEVGEISEDNETCQICEDLLNLREKCKKQVRSNEAFELYFKTICNGGEPEFKKTCGLCANFHKLEACTEVKEEQEGCDDWTSEEQEEEELLEEGESEI